LFVSSSQRCFFQMPDEQIWDLSPREARALQCELAPRVLLQPLPRSFAILGASDIGYARTSNQLVAVMVTFTWPELQPLETSQVISSALFPYIPGLLSFREAPTLVVAFRKLKTPPHVLLCDGQGIAHPRRLGLASHLGLCLGIPTVGCAKKRLCGEHGLLLSHRGASTPLVLNGEVVGSVFRSREGVKPIYISPGHLADVESSQALVADCLGRFRIPEPLRRAHNLATDLRRALTAQHPVFQ
jgi:deoxyribonuclease V